MIHINKSRTNHKGPSIGAELCIAIPNILVIKDINSPYLPLFHNINPQPLSEQKSQAAVKFRFAIDTTTIKKNAVNTFHKTYGMKIVLILFLFFDCI